ncbi:uncharacterized protein LOC133819703 isoform X2 [Humulus lupulus]|uniref:uncharacterized protein LOC133819703 isoform X2 n=1 Tax=Humulus lupulus TaxID=3486 RepID=UPI002B41077C|nr:uncharacterized protein LOC133819703 isoform X2 [Humulus lupulus]
MASLPTYYTLHLHQCFSSLSPTLCYLPSPRFSRRFPPSLSRKFELFAFRQNLTRRDKVYSLCCCKAGAEVASVPVDEESERPPFDINLAVILAGFAFEAYTSPPDNVGRQEIDAADCKTVYLSETFVQEIYDGQLFVKLKKGLDLPAMDPWGTSDPYVIMELDGQVVKSKIKWGTKEPKWNEDFTFNIKLPAKKNIQVAAWDANLVTPHKRMGNAGINLDCLCDGELHEVLVELEGMGGGGKLQLEVKYKDFDEIDGEKDWWRISFVSEFFRKNGFDSAMKKFVGTETVQASQFVDYAFGQLKSFNDAYLTKDKLSNNENEKSVIEMSSEDALVSDMPSQIQSSVEGPSNDAGYGGSNLEDLNTDDDGIDNGYFSELVNLVGESKESDKDFWKSFANVINQSVVQKLGLPTPEKLKWDGFDLLNSIGLQSKKIAEASYVKSGLATPEGIDEDLDTIGGSLDINTIRSSLPDIQKATKDLLKQTESVLGALMVLSAAISEANKEARLSEKSKSKQEDASNVDDDFLRSNKNEKLASRDVPMLDEKKAEEMRELFSTAESAMEAWAMLATSLGQPSFIKSEFEKICFLDNETTDTQVAIWRDPARRRLVVAFRGTEQAKWKDLKTDLMLAPAGLNPERIGGDFKQEVQVHSGFLSAYDSVRIRIFTIIKQAIGYSDDHDEVSLKWHVYLTGHSLGGALATLLALELSSSQLAKRGAISLTMYNFGSPRVGNKRFADIYNQKVKDSWRVVNHRDIIPTVPRLMGYCHVAQPAYLGAGVLRTALENLELSGDGYHGDVIGEATPDVLVSEFMKGEKEIVERILQTEINIFRAIRDGSALMQHMEDFYYITLLENVKSNYLAARSNASDEGSQTSE